MSGRMSGPNLPAVRRCQGDAGSMIVETAVILPILIIFLCGIIDFGVGFRDRITIQSSVRTGTRAAASLGRAQDADEFALTTLWASLSSYKFADLTKVIIFSTTSAGTVPASCLGTAVNNAGAGVTNSCNVYSKQQAIWAGSASFINDPTSAATKACSASTGMDRWWCPNIRDNLLTDNAFAGPDYLGMYVEVTYTPLTKLFRSSIILTDKTVMRIEPG